MRRSLGLVTLVLALGAPGLARADAVAWSCSVGPTGAARVRPLTARGACTGFEVQDAAGRLLSRVEGGLHGSGTFLATGDGRTVIFVHSSPLTGLRPDGTFRPDPADRLNARLPGVVVFRDGRHLATHALEDLLVRTRLVTLSTSHVGWVAGDSLRRVPGATWVLETTSFRSIEFDTATGAVVQAEDTPSWLSCEAIAYGAVRDPGPGVTEMAVAHPAKGPLAGLVRFTPAPGLVVPRPYATLCFARRGDGWTATRAFDLMLNASPARP